MVVLTDPREIFCGYFTQGDADNKVNKAVLLLKNGASTANYKAQWNTSETPIATLFNSPNHYDVVWVVAAEPMEPIGPKGNPIANLWMVSLTPTAIDKSTVDAQQLLWKAASETLRVIRENCVGSARIVNKGTPEEVRLGSLIIFGIKILVEYYQYVSAYGTYTLPNRRFYNMIKELRVGVTAASYSSCGAASGLGPLRLEPEPPYIVIKIPGATSPVFQNLGNTYGKATLLIRDREAVTQLFKTIDVDNDVAGTQVAVSGATRNIIDYLCVVVYNTKIVNSSDARTSETTSIVFNGARIDREPYPPDGIDDPAAPILLEWYYTSITETDA